MATTYGNATKRSDCGRASHMEVRIFDGMISGWRAQEIEDVASHPARFAHANRASGRSAQGRWESRLAADYPALPSQPSHWRIPFHSSASAIVRCSDDEKHAGHNGNRG